MPVTTNTSWAADNQPNAPRVYPPGQEKATTAGAAKDVVTNLADTRDKSK